MKTLLFSSPILDSSGYGEAGRLYLKSLLSVGIEPKINIPTYSTKRPPSFQDIPEDLKRFKYKDGDPLYDVFLNHITPDISFVDFNKPSYLYSVWESSRIPASAVPRCNAFDKVFTASEYSKQAFLNAGVKVPVVVVPHPIVKKEFKRNENIAKQFEGRKVFFSNFEWHIGKGYDLLIPAFVKAFEGRKDVVLIIKTCSMDVAGSYDKKKIVSEMKGGSEFPSIVVIDSIISEDNLFTLYDICDVYVSCSRREAFGLTMSEAVSFGKNVVAPNIGGQMEFLSNYVSFLPIESSIVDIPNTLEPSRGLYRGQKWVEPKIESLVENLLLATNYVNDGHDESLVTKEVLKKFSLEKIGTQLAKEVGIL